MEGVMMKSTDKIAIAVRKQNGKITVKKQKYVPWTKKSRILNTPLIRGFVVFIESIAEGYKAMNYSAAEAMDEEETGSSAIMVVAGIFAFILALFLFKFVPFWAAYGMSNMLSTFKERFAFNLTEGTIKAGMLIGYIFLISKMKDVKRVFEYHGAEHKVINCYEAEGKVSVKNAKKYLTFHRRCGTSFLLLVVMVSIAVYIFVPLGMSFLSRFLWRLALLPLIAGVSYEILKASSTYPKNLIFRTLSWPGVFLQKLTTSEPDEKQLGVAVKAFKAVALP